MELGSGAVVGWCAVGSAVTVEIVARSGVDLVCVDAQHGLVGDLLPLLQACGETPALVRVSHNAPEPIAQALDRGAAGVIVPLVNSADEARAAVAACAYPPAGSRSFGPSRLGWTGQDVLARGGCVIMIETMAAVADLAGIAAVPGVDALFVGPSDLSLSSGRSAVPPLDDAGYRDLLRGVTSATDLPVGVFCGDPDWAPVYRGLGFTWLTLPAEATLLRQGLHEAVRRSRG